MSSVLDFLAGGLLQASWGELLVYLLVAMFKAEDL